MPSIPRTLVFLFICSLVIPFSVSQAEDWLVPGDLNNDQVTNHLDFFQLLRDYDPSGHRLAPEADLNSDLRVNHQDIHWALIGRHLGRNSITPPDPNHTGSVTGVVREDVGMLTVHIPIEGALIYLSSANGIRMMTRSGPDGTFHFANVPAGEAQIASKHPDYHQKRISVLVKAGEEASCIIEMPPRKPDLADLSGYVRGSAGDATIPPVPLEGAVVRIVPLIDEIPAGDFDNRHQPGVEDAHQAATTDKDGHYAFHDLPNGRYRLIATARGYQSQEREIEIKDPSVDLYEDFLLQPVEHLFGRLAGIIYSHDPRSMRPMDMPLAGAKILLESIWSQPQPFESKDNRDLPHPHNRIYQTVSDASGHYSLERVLPGDYVAHVWARGHEPATAEIKIDAHQTTTQDFHLEFIILSRGAVAGQVTGGTPGEPPVPVENAVVALLKQPEDPDPARIPIADLITASRVRSTTTDADGYYAFREIPEGNYLVIAWARGWGQVTGAAHVIGGITAEVNLHFIKTPPPSLATLRAIVYGGGNPADPSDLPVPISGALVIAFPAQPEPVIDPPRLNSTLEDRNQPVFRRFSGITNESGECVIGDLPPGRYRVMAMARGYQPREKGVSLPPGVTTTVDFVLPPRPSGPGMVLGMVFSRGVAAGRINPISGAAVRLAGRGLPGAPDLLENLTISLPPVDIPLFQTITNEEGYFEFAPVPVGQYLLTVSADGYKPEMREIEVHPGGTVKLSIELSPVPPHQVGSLFGHVWEDQDPNIDAIPRSISGALVIAVPFSFDIGLPEIPSKFLPDPGHFPGGHLPFVTRTDESGAYKFDQLPAGKLVVLVLAKDFLPNLKQTEILPDRTNILDFYMRPIHQPPTKARLYGVLTENSPYPTFAPVYVQGAEVSLFPIRPGGGATDDKDTGEPRKLTTYSDDRGRYDFKEIPAGSYRIVIKAEKYHPLEESVRLPSGAEVQRDFSLQPILPIDKGNLFGHVYETGHVGIQAPLENAIVRLVPDDMIVIEVFPPPNVGFDRVTDENGAYRFEGIPAQKYRVVVIKEGFEILSDYLVVPASQSIERDWYLVRTPNPETAGLSGLVREGNTDTSRVWKPIANARLMLELLLPPAHDTEKDLPVFWETTSNEEGRYRFENLPSGAFRIRVSKEGYQVAEKIFELAPGENRQEDFALNPSPEQGTRMHGYVSEDVGLLDIWVPVGGAILTLDDPSNEHPARSTTTEPDGSYSFEGIQPGHYDIHIEARGYEAHRERIQIPSEPEFLQSFRLKKVSSVEKARIEGTILFVQPDGDTHPAPGIPVFLEQPELMINNANPRMTLTNLEGHYKFKELVPGAYQVKVQIPGREALREAVEVLPGEAKTVDFNIPLLPTQLQGVQAK